MFTECGWLQNRDRMTRTSVYVLIVTELLDDWEDARTLGESAQVTRSIAVRPHLQFP